MEIRDDIQTNTNSEKVKQSPTRSLFDPLVFVISNGNI